MRFAPALAAAALLLGAGGTGTAAFAADEISIDHVQSDDGTVSMLLGVDQLPAGTPDLSSVTVTINGAAVNSTAETVEGGQVERTTVLVLDASNSMKGDKLAAATSAIDAFLTSAPEDVQIGLVTFAGNVQQTVPPTTDHQSIIDELDQVQLKPGTKLYDAVAAGAQLAGDEGARSLLVLSDGADTGSTTTIDGLSGTASDAGVVVDVVALGQSAEQQATLEGLASAAGGRVISADPAALGAVFSAQAEALASQVLVTFDLPDGMSGEQTVEASVTAGGTIFTDSAFVSLASSSSGAAGAPRVITPSDPKVGRNGLLLGALAFGVGVAGLLAFAIGGGRRKSLSDQRIGNYFAYGDGSSGASRKSRNRAKAQTSLRDTAVDLAGQVVKGDFEDRLTKRLGGAGNSLKPAEWLLLHGAIALGAGFAGLIVQGGALMVMFFIVGAVAPWFWLKRKHSKRLAAFNAQLAETLTLMAGGLSAGLSLPQSVDTVVREGHQPMAGELGRALVEQRLGIPIEETLENVAERMESEDFGWVVMAIRIQREVGGNLAELLNTVSNTLRDREYLRRQVRVLSAEGRFSGYVLTGLPIMLFCYMVAFKRDFIEPMYTTGTGYIMLGVALLMLAGGGFVMSRLVKIKV